MNTIGFIGAGNMAYAIAGGICANFPSLAIRIYDIHPEQYTRFEELGAKGKPSIDELVLESDVIFLSVKPQNFESVLAEIKAVGKFEDKLFITIAAGISISYIQNGLGAPVRVVRIMPNTPLMKGAGASALSLSDGVTEEEKNFVEKLFAGMGVAKFIPESLMDPIIAVHGSSPAYIYLFAKAIVDHAVKDGIDGHMAMELFCQTLCGSAKMLLESGHTPEELIQMVCSPGGTTMKAMEVFDDRDLCGIVDEAMEACTKQAKVLGK